MRKIIISVLFLFAFIMTAFCADDNAKLSNGYKEIKLGMSMDEVKKKIKYSAEFAPERIEAVQTRMEPDVRTLTASGVNPMTGLIKIGYFFFNDDDQLVAITIKINEEKISYYSILKRFTEKYGNPDDLEPSRAVWSDDETRIILEKPCELKYQSVDYNSDPKKNTDILYNKLRDKFIDEL
ncbi:MAG: hypothetical protein II707_10965 [Spirochaetales bacterium]|nr:hypothetical protein [Spirochaetales bacterium]